MRGNTPRPPRWAEALLLPLLRPSDCEAISGDLREEYAAARQPALGTGRANAWYFGQVLSVLWQLIRPCALAMAGLVLVLLMVRTPWNPRLVQAPGVSLLDALVYLWAG